MSTDKPVTHEPLQAGVVVHVHDVTKIYPMGEVQLHALCVIVYQRASDCFQKALIANTPVCQKYVIIDLRYTGFLRSCE
jgi:hypothetical protein